MKTSPNAHQEMGEPEGWADARRVVERSSTPNRGKVYIEEGDRLPALHFSTVRAKVSQPFSSNIFWTACRWHMFFFLYFMHFGLHTSVPPCSIFAPISSRALISSEVEYFSKYFFTTLTSCSEPIFPSVSSLYLLVTL